MQTLAKSKLKTYGLILAMAAACCGTAGAAEYPEKPVRLLLGLAAGGPNDLIARILAEGMGKDLGQPVLVENRPGAGSQIAIEAAARSAPDGYALLFFTTSSTIVPLTNASFNMDLRKIFVPVVQVESHPTIFTVHKSVPANNMAEFIAYAKANPGLLNAGIQGASDNLADQWLQKLAGIQTKIVTFSGGGPMMQSMLSGTVHYMYAAMSSVEAPIKAGTLRAIAVTSRKRFAPTPNLAPISDTIPEFALDIWAGIVAPTGTPRPIIDRLNGSARKQLAAPDVVQRFVQAGVEPVGGTPEQFGTYLLSEIKKWEDLAKSAGLKPQ